MFELINIGLLKPYFTITKIVMKQTAFERFFPSILNLKPDLYGENRDVLPRSQSCYQCIYDQL